ncbi:unnamed protein product, partial [Iphiclides podalirius]
MSTERREEKTGLTFSLYSSSPLYLMISGAMKPSVPPKPLVPDGGASLLMPDERSLQKSPSLTWTGTGAGARSAAEASCGRGSCHTSTFSDCGGRRGSGRYTQGSGCGKSSKPFPLHRELAQESIVGRIF